MKVKAKQTLMGSDLTNGKVYKVLDKCEHFYTITNDDGVAAKIPRNCCEVINGHPHADLIMKYAEIAQYDAEPWKHFESRIKGDVWCKCDTPCGFHENLEYRLKPRIININGFEVPEPLRSVPAYGTQYFIVDLPLVGSLTWTDSSDEYQWLKAGIIHLTREAAEKHLEALLSFTKERE